MQQVTDNPGEHRYELQADGGAAFAYYEDRDGIRTFTHTIVPEELRGQGIGSALIAGALGDVRRRDGRLIAQCPFVGDYIAAHPEYEDLLA